jgi:hypothetical protein
VQRAYNDIFVRVERSLRDGQSRVAVVEVKEQFGFQQEVERLPLETVIG